MLFLVWVEFDERSEQFAASLLQCWSAFAAIYVFMFRGVPTYIFRPLWVVLYALEALSAIFIFRLTDPLLGIAPKRIPLLLFGLQVLVYPPHLLLTCCAVVAALSLHCCGCCLYNVPKPAFSLTAADLLCCCGCSPCTDVPAAFTCPKARF